MTNIPVYALTISPHPHDTEWGIGGTAAKWTAEGKRVVCVVCTNGDKGSGNPDFKPEELAKTRKKEQAAAAKILGIKEVVFLDQPDLGLEDTPALRKQLLKQILTYRPEIVATRDPYNGRYVSNRDHRILGRLVMDMVWPYAQAPNTFPDLLAEGLLPHKVKEMLLWSPDQPNYRLDITDTYEKKKSALRAHKTQIIDWIDPPGGYEEADKNFFKMIDERNAAAAEGTAFKYAEAFVRVPIPPRL
jgi:LmbE family N-acetylglucosaminyl deacetylase